MRTARVGVLCGGCLALGAVLLLQLHWNRQRQDARPGAANSVGGAAMRADRQNPKGIEARSYDSANRGARRYKEAWVADGRLQFYDAFSRVENLDVKVFEQGDEDWLPTQRWIGSGGRGEDFGLARIACGLKHMKDEEQGCRITYEIVMDRTAPTSGVVGAARIQPRQELRDACRAYADCVARSWLGLEGPLADKGGDLFAFEQGEILHKMRGTAEEKAARLRDEIAKMRGEIEALGQALNRAETEKDREHFEYLRELYGNAIEQYEAMLEETRQ